MTPRLVHHVAIADDWEMSLAFGSYEAATRGVPYSPGGYIRAVPGDEVQTVLDERYADLTLPLLLVTIDVDALAAAGTDVEEGAGHAPRIRGPLPSADDQVIVAVRALRREKNRWVAPPDL
jgi:uncharacterized protein (DUF952 family)